MQKITTFLMFNDRAEEAVDLYVSLFKNSRIVGTVRYEDAGPERDQTVTGATFELDGQQFMAMNGGPYFSFAEGMSLHVRCDTQDEIDELWEKLSDGGEQQPCGWVKDRFGVSWQIVPSMLEGLLQGPDAEGAKRAMEAMLQMGKLEIAALERAYRG